MTLKLLHYDFTIKYIPEKLNLVADMFGINPSGIGDKEHLITISFEKIWDINLITQRPGIDNKLSRAEGEK